MHAIREIGRIEKDSLGALEIPAAVLYGIHTLRGVANFPLSGRRLCDEPALIAAMVRIKKAAALANRDIGAIHDGQATAIAAAAVEVLSGRHREHFVIDLYEGSGGTSLNMNVNEVLANRGLEVMGHSRGDYGALHPNDHVNLGQSTNDVLPTALKLAAHAESEATLRAVRGLADSLGRKRAEFRDVLRLGRTCLQDAQPMTLGQAFGGYEAVVRRCAARLEALRDDLLEVPLGGTAIGTGLGAAPGYRERVFVHLSALLEAPVRPPADAFDGMQNLDEAARLSAELRTCANALWKIASDLILLSSGPDGGIAELVLPAVQAGSSIMPGKINPVIPMMVCQTAFAVAGNDTAIALATQQGQLEINHFEPLVAVRLLDSLRLVEAASQLFAERCVDGIAADERRSLDHLLASSAVATAMVPKLGYARVSELVRTAARAGRSFLEEAQREGLIDGARATDLLRECSQGRSGVQSESSK